MEDTVDFVNRLNDQDWGWWPFVFLRPDQEERMTNAYVATIALVYGPIGGMVTGIVLVLLLRGIGAPIDLKSAAWLVLTVLVATTVMFFPIYRATFAVCWNRRADRLAEEMADGADETHRELYGQWVPRGPLRRSNDA